MSKVVIEMENGKKMTAELMPQFAPETVENFELRKALAELVRTN